GRATDGTVLQLPDSRRATYYSFMVGKFLEGPIPVRAHVRFAVRRWLCWVQCTIAITDEPAGLDRIRPILGSRGWTRLRQVSLESGAAEELYARTIRVTPVEPLIKRAVHRQIWAMEVVLARSCSEAHITMVCLEWPRLRPDDPRPQMFFAVRPREGGVRRRAT
ncbi:hypothetical protein, partial [Nocardia sp. NPDC058497]|uniref:hypothetical protein n=1 Tax=Nocardia sp. NPDC058497 TaxID=3346529 RepID=UPI003646319C